MTQRAKGLRQFVVASQQTRAEQVVARQVWRLVALQRSRAKPRHLRRAAQQLESEVRVARPAWRFAARPAFAGGGEALDAGGEAAGAAEFPGLACAGAASSSTGAALPMLAKSGPMRILPSNAGRSKM